MSMILPILFPLYVVSTVYLLFRSLTQGKYLWVVLISFSTPILVEISQVAQFGRNYFSWFIGIILLIGLAVYDFFYSVGKHETFLTAENSTQAGLPKELDEAGTSKASSKILRKIFQQRRHDERSEEFSYIEKQKSKQLFIGLIFMLIIHAGINFLVFMNDIFPSRLASTQIYEWLIKQNVHQISSYKEHPLNKNILQFLVNPKAVQQLSLRPMNSILQASNGYILVQPITGKSVLNACAYSDYDTDPFLTMLYASGQFKKYVVKEFKTLSSSRLWAQEEEVCAYRDLVINQISSEDREKGKAWILDAKKLHQEWIPQVIKSLRNRELND